MSHVNVGYGIIRLGRAAGKMKYLLVDHADASLNDRYIFEVRVMYDQDGGGINIIAWICDSQRTECSGWPVSSFIWELHFGPIPSGYVVVNKNGILVDCRSENLQLVRSDECQAYQRSILREKESVYWSVIQQVVINPLDEIQRFANSEKLAVCYDRNGDPVSDGGDHTLFYECHYAPCVRTERHILQFNVCGRCRVVRVNSFTTVRSLRPSKLFLQWFLSLLRCYQFKVSGLYSILLQFRMSTTWLVGSQKVLYKSITSSRKPGTVCRQISLPGAQACHVFPNETASQVEPTKKAVVDWTIE